jgi:hypothetical protein
MSDDPTKEIALKFLSPASPRNDSETRRVPRMLSAAAVAMAILILAMRPGATSQVRAGADDPAKEKPVGGALHPDAVAQYERTLAGFDRRLGALANLLFEEAAMAQKSRHRVVDVMIKTRSAEAQYLNAKLGREVAQIAVREFVEGTAVQEQAVVEGEIKLARSNLERSQRDTAEAKLRLARISAVADQSAFGLKMVYSYTDRVTSAELQEKKAGFMLEQAESKERVLNRYFIGKRTKELDSEVKKAHSDELAKQAHWELAKGLEAKVREESQRPDFSEDRKKILALLDQAIPIEEKLRARLAEASKANTPQASKPDDIVLLLNDLGSLVDRAESVRDIGDFARLKPQVQQAARWHRVSSVK